MKEINCIVCGKQHHNKRQMRRSHDKMRMAYLKLSKSNKRQDDTRSIESFSCSRSLSLKQQLSSKCISEREQISEKKASSDLQLRNKSIKRYAVNGKNWKRTLLSESNDAKQMRVDHYITALDEVYAQYHRQDQKVRSKYNKKHVRAVKKGYTNYKDPLGKTQFKQKFKRLVQYDERILWFYDPEFLRQNAHRFGLTFAETPEEIKQIEIYRMMPMEQGKLYEKLLKERKIIERKMQQRMLIVRKSYRKTNGFVPINLIAECDDVEREYITINRKIQSMEKTYMNEQIEQQPEQEEYDEESIELIIQEPIILQQNVCHARELTFDEQIIKQIRLNGFEKTEDNLDDQYRELDHRIKLFQKNHHLIPLIKQENQCCQQMRTLEKKYQQIKGKRRQLLKKWKSENEQLLNEIKNFQMRINLVPAAALTQMDEQIQQNCESRPRPSPRKTKKIRMIQTRTFLFAHFRTSHPTSLMKKWNMLVE